MPYRKLDKRGKHTGNSVALSVIAGSPVFHKFIRHLERANRKRDGRHFICLTCWIFLDAGQQLLHQRHMHVCATVGSIYDEETFLRQANTYNRFTVESQCVQIFKKYSARVLERLDIMNGTLSTAIRYSIDQNLNRVARRENQLLKGCPPLLDEPVVPMNMVPFNYEEPSPSH